MNFTFFSSAHGTFSRIDHILDHKSSLGKFKKNRNHSKHLFCVLTLNQNYVLGALTEVVFQSKYLYLSCVYGFIACVKHFSPNF